MRRRGLQRGYTLLELLAVIAIAISLIGVSAVGVRRLRQSDLRTASSQMAGAIKFTYDRAVTGGRYYRLVIDLDQKTYFPEVSDDRFYLVRGRNRNASDEDTDPNQPQQPAAPGKSGGGMGSILGLMGGGSGVPSATVAAKVGAGKARFTADTTAASSKRQAAPLRGVTITSVWTARFDEPVTQGKAYLYFYPEGMTERAIIHLSDTSENVYSLLVHPLTGKVQIQNWRVEIPRTGDTDDTGEAR